jgi:oligosaccharide repeat unit polymerase
MSFIILLTTIFSIILLFLIRKRNILEPAKIFSLYWSIQLILIPISFLNVYDFHGPAFLYILVTIVIILFTSTIGKAIATSSGITNKRIEFNEKRSIFIFVIIVILAFIYPFYQMAHYGFSIHDFLSINQLLDMNNTIAADRYTGYEKFTIIDQLLLVFVYLAPLYTGYISTFFKNKKLKFFYIAFLPALIVALSQAMKAGFIASVFLWLSGKIVAMYSTDKQLPKFNAKVIVISTLIILVFFGLLFFSMLLRTNEINSDTISFISYRFVNYSFGHLVAFDDWILTGWNSYYPFELKTFYGISNYLGFASREQGIFTDFFTYGNGNISGEMVTNVYTVFRSLIEDFGILGSFIFSGLLGLFSGFSFLKIKNNPNAIAWKVIHSAFLFFIFYSFITSVWAYTSYIVVFIVFYLLLKLSYKPLSNDEY